MSNDSSPITILLSAKKSLKMKKRLSISFPEFGGIESSVMVFDKSVNIGATTLIRTIDFSAWLVSKYHVDNHDITFNLSKLSVFEGFGQ